MSTTEERIADAAHTMAYFRALSRDPDDRDRARKSALAAETAAYVKAFERDTATYVCLGDGSWKKSIDPAA